MTKPIKLEENKYYAVKENNKLAYRIHIKKRTPKFVWYEARYADGERMRNYRDMRDRARVKTDESGNEWVEFNPEYYTWGTMTKEKYFENTIWAKKSTWAKK